MSSFTEIEILNMLHRLDKKVDVLIASATAHEVLDNTRFSSLYKMIAVLSTVSVSLGGVILASLLTR